MADKPGKLLRPNDVPTAARRRRRVLPDSTKRLLFVLLGVVVLAGSITGFYFTAEAFDERSEVLVAARGIAAGEELTAADMRSEAVVIGAIPHVPWSPAAPLAFEGMIALSDIPAGALMALEMVVAPETVPVGPQLEVIVPLDTSLATEELAERDLVLLADPGQAPSGEDPGRPQRVVRDFVLTNFDGNQMRLFLPPEEWAQWEQVLADVGGLLQVVPVGVGADPAETAERLNGVWEARWISQREEIARRAELDRPRAGPGELEVVVSLDSSLVPTVIDGDSLVLLVDPGEDPQGNNPGRPRSVLRALELANFRDGEMTLFVQPEQWEYWRTLSDVLGADPMILPVAPGTDVDDMTTRLNAVWRNSWEQSLAALTGTVLTPGADAS